MNSLRRNLKNVLTGQSWWIQNPFRELDSMIPASIGTHVSITCHTHPRHTNTHKKKLHRHRPQIEKISETFFHAASMGQWYSGCLDKQISQHLPTQLTWANILWKRVLFCLVEWSKWWCVWTQRFACRIDITEVASKKKCFSLPPTISNLGTLKSHLKAILVPNDSSKSGNFHASVLLGFA